MRIRGGRRPDGAGRAARRRGGGEPPAELGTQPGEDDRVRRLATRLVVEVADRARSWHEAALDARRAYGRWQLAGDGERGLAAACYLAAIEREEKAASEYSLAADACGQSASELRLSASPPSRTRRQWRLTYDER
jgi:hypothetical protein